MLGPLPLARALVLDHRLALQVSPLYTLVLRPDVKIAIAEFAGFILPLHSHYLGCNAVSAGSSFYNNCIHFNYTTLRFYPVMMILM